MKLIKEHESEDRFQLLYSTLKNPATFYETQDFHT